ncbi:MAG: argininosuccinate lyase [Candidatus Methylomirabilales bacterium]
MSEKLWGGRFKEEPHPLAEAYTASIHFDKRLARYDLEGSLAHVKMLVKSGIIGEDEAERIIKGLEEIKGEIERGEFPFDPAFEDIHLNIERRLIEKIGEVGGKLHTARSRNDQIALDLRLYLREEMGEIQRLIRNLQEVLVEQAEANLDLVMPGYTHLQRAQPVLLAHHLLAYFEMLDRDRERFADCFRRVDVLPLGSGALAGAGFPIDRDYVAELLGFSAISANSIDAVSDRDFVVEFLAASSILMMHLSRLSEELTLWASAEFGFIELPDAFTTGSSMMPQKKNPDVAELCRGKTGRVYGALFALLTLLKGLPLSYNRDLQEDKEPLFDTVDTVKATLRVFQEMLRAVRFNGDRMREAALAGFLNATDVADYLVEKGMPFRQAHEVVGRLVQECLKQKKRIEELPLEELKRFSPLFEEDVYPFITLEACLERCRSFGGTAKGRVVEALRAARRRCLQ